MDKGTEVLENEYEKVNMKKANVSKLKSDTLTEDEKKESTGGIN